MTRMMCAALGLAIAVGCKQKPADEMGATPGQSGAMGTSGDMGSAMGMTMRDATVTPAVDAALPPKTLDEMAKRYEECFRSRREKRAEEFATCLAPGAKYEAVGLSPPDAKFDIAQTDELQILLVTQGTMIALVKVTAEGTGYYAARVVTFESDGRFTSVREFFDNELALAKTPPPTGIAQKESLISKDDDVEKANTHTALAILAMSGKPDAAAVADKLADDFTWAEEVLSGKLFSKNATIKSIAGRGPAWVVKQSWAAGNYVAAEVWSKDLPMFAIMRFADLKLSRTWSFYQTKKLRNR